MKQSTLTGILVIGSFIALIAALFIFEDKPISTPTPIIEKNEAVQKVTKVAPIPDIGKEIDDAIVKLKDFNIQNATSIADLIQKAGEFDRYLPIIYKGQGHSLEMSERTKELVDLLKSTQNKFFPLIRKKYGEVAGELVWEDDIYIKTLGPRFDRIQFIGGTFAANRNIKENYEGMQPILDKLRFKRIDYKWIPSATEYTSYQVMSDKDDILPGVIINNKRQ